MHVIEAMAAKGGFARHDDPDIIAMNCRIAGEIGADIIKTDWCSDTARFRAIATQSLAPVVVAGGPARARFEDTLNNAQTAIAAGAAGLMFGRNVFEQQDPGAALKQLAKVVHADVPG